MKRTDKVSTRCVTLTLDSVATAINTLTKGLLPATANTIAKDAGLIFAT
jgi:hypothetical protein